MAEELPRIKGLDIRGSSAKTQVASALATLLQTKAAGTSLETRPVWEFGKAAEDIYELLENIGVSAADNQD